VWTEDEILVLIEAKSVQDSAIAENGGARATHTTANVKWDAVEDACFNNGVHRSAHSCKDKWENQLGEVKKVRDYQKRIPSGRDGYWTMDSATRREAALPPNVSRKVFDAVMDCMGGAASMEPPSVLESGGAREDQDDGVVQDGPKGTVGFRKRKWGAAKKELIGTLKENEAALGDQLKASKEEKGKRFKESMEFEEKKLNKQLELEERRLKQDELLGNAMQMMAQAFAMMVQQSGQRQ
jgi:hypothetical protein